MLVEDDETFEYDIFMNNILNHKGYRFFQASFDPDEKGTVLSVNDDFWGTFITYAGYFLLYLSMMGIFFQGNTRFKFLAKQLNKKTSVLIFLFLSSSLFAQSSDTLDKSTYIDSIIESNSFTKEHSSKFGEVVIQDSGGRMKPANTFASELLRKVSRSNTYNGLNSDQVLLSIMDNPGVWFNAPIVYIKSGQKGDTIKNILGLDNNLKRAPLVSFFDSLGNYKLATNLEKAYLATIPTQIEKDVIELDRRVNLLYSALEGKIMRIFPIPNDDNNKWVSLPEVKDVNFNGACHSERNGGPSGMLLRRVTKPSGRWARRARTSSDGMVRGGQVFGPVTPSGKARLRANWTVGPENLRVDGSDELDGLRAG